MKYSNDINAQYLLSLLKSYSISKIIASPGTTNIAIVGSMQNDDYFEMYSSVDERSAAYMACGLAAESGEPVAIVCTGATASRNYLPGITEAYYRKLPILVIAGSYGLEAIGHLRSQVIDRTQSPKDTFVYSCHIKSINSKKDEHNNVLLINKALISLKKHGGGPVLISITTSANLGFDSQNLPSARVIKYYNYISDFPEIAGNRIAIFVGSHNRMSQELVDSIDSFCASYNAVVFCDHTSGYYGKYRVVFALVCSQEYYDIDLLHPDLLIHIGEVSGDTYTTGKLRPKRVWRVSPDGEIRDFFNKLSAVFEIDECPFFAHYAITNSSSDDYYEKCKEEYETILSQIPDLSFGNIYIAKHFSARLPKSSVVHFGIFNTLRSWNFFQLDKTIESSCNVGGFGIDGATSTTLGASLANPKRIHFLFLGDLAFFYDLNTLGNRHVGNNLRILLINNGRGIEFRKKDHPGYLFGDAADFFIAAGGHFGNMSKSLVKNFVEALGFEYLSASNKEELTNVSDRFLQSDLTARSIVLEVFPEVEDEVNNLDKIRHIKSDLKDKVAKSAKSIIKGTIIEKFLK